MKNINSIKNAVKSVVNFVKFNGATNIADIKDGEYIPVSTEVLDTRGDLVYAKLNVKAGEVSIEVTDLKTKEVKCSLGLTPIQENTFLNSREFDCSPVKIGKSTKVMTKEDRYQSFLLKMNMEKKFMKTFDELYEPFVYVDFSKGAVCLKGIFEDHYLDIVNNVELENVDGFKRYSFGYYTTGSVKVATSFWLEEGVSVCSLLKSNLPQIHKAYTKLQRLSEVKARKIAPRLSLAMTGNIKFFGVDAVAVVRKDANNKFGQFGDMVIDGKIVNGAQGTGDGRFFIENDTFKEALRLPTKEEAMQYLIQARIENIFINKGQGQARSREYISLLLETLYATGNLYIYGVELKDGWDKTVESRRVVFDRIPLVVDSDTVKLGGDEDIMDEYDITNEGVIINILKMESKPSDAKTAIQTLEKVYDSAAKSGNKEDIERLDNHFFGMFKNEYTGKLIRMLIPGSGIACLSTTYKQDIVKEINKSLTPIASYSAVSDMQNKSMKDIRKMSLVLKHEDGTSACKTYVLDTDISAMLINGGILKKGEIYTPNYSSELDEILKGFGKESKEYKYYVEREGKVILTRYPSLGLFERISGKQINFDEICERLESKLAAGEITQECCDVLKYEFKYSSKASLMIGALAELLKELSGGDIDMDHINAITDKEYVNALYNKEECEPFSMCLKPEGVNNLNKKEQKEFDDSYNSLTDAVNSGLKANSNKSKSNNPPVTIKGAKYYNSLSERFYKEIYGLTVIHEGTVGPVNITNTKCVSALTCIRLGNRLPAVEILTALIGKQGTRKAKYEVKCFDEDGKKCYGDRYLRMLVEVMQTIVWTDQVIIDCFEDLNKLSVVVMSSNIDGAKTGDYLEPKIKTPTIVADFMCKIESVQVIGSRFDKIERVIPDTIGNKVRVTTLAKEQISRKIIYIKTPLGNLQDRMISFINNEVHRFVTENCSLFDYKKEEISLFIKTVSRVKKADVANGTTVMQDLTMLKSLYEQYAKDYRAKRAEIDPKDDDAAMKYKDLKEEYVLELEPIRKAANAIISHLTFSKDKKVDMVTKGALALALSVYQYDFNGSKTMEYIASSTNKFAYNVLPELVYGYYTEGTGSYRSEGNIIQLGDAKVGETVELVKGANKDLRLFIKEKFTGSVTVASRSKVFKNISFMDDVEEIISEGSLLIIDKAIADSMITKQYNEKNANKKKLSLLTSISKETQVMIDGEGCLLSTDSTVDFIGCGEEYFFDGEFDANYTVASITEAYIYVPAQINRDSNVKIESENRYVYVLDLKEVE